MSLSVRAGSWSAKRVASWGLSKICRDAGTDAGTVWQRRKTPQLAPGQVCDAGTDVWTDCQGLTQRLSLHTQSETPGQVNSDKHAS